MYQRERERVERLRERERERQRVESLRERERECVDSLEGERESSLSLSRETE